jgi:hypothetical protein
MSKSIAFAVAAAAALVMTVAPAQAGDGTNLLSLAPESSQLVLVFDVADSRDSTLLQKGFEKILAMQPDAKAKMTEIGIDPMKDVDTLAFAAGGPKDFDDMDKLGSMVIIIIEGRLPKDKLAAIPGTKTSAYKGITIYTKDDADVAFVGDRLFFTKKGKMKGHIDLAQSKAKGKSLAGSGKAKKMRDAIALTDTTTDLWIAVLIPDKAKKDMKADGVVANSVSAGANFTADLALSARVESNNEDGAKKAVAMIQGQLAQVTGAMSQFGLAKAAKSLMVSQDKASIRMSITLTEAELNSIFSLAQGMAGGGGGLGGAP